MDDRVDPESASGYVETPRCIVCDTAGTCLYADMRDLLFGVAGTWTVYSCPECGHVWQFRRPENERIGDLYQAYYTHNTLQDNWIRRSLKRGIPVAELGFVDPQLSTPERLLGRLAGKVGPLREFANSVTMGLGGRPPGHLLDIGCGAGEFLSLIRHLGWTVEGTEVDPAAAAAAQARVPGAIVHAGLLQDLGLAECSYDAATLSHVIEHVPDPAAEAEAIFRVLRPGGVAAVITPNGGGMGAGRFGADWRGWEVPRHFHVFRPDGLAHVFRQAGFEITSVATPSSIAYQIWTASQRLRRLGRGAETSALTGILDRAAGVAYWCHQYRRNRRERCGEEILLLATRPGDGT